MRPVMSSEDIDLSVISEFAMGGQLRVAHALPEAHRRSEAAIKPWIQVGSTRLRPVTPISWTRHLASDDR